MRKKNNTFFDHYFFLVLYFILFFWFRSHNRQKLTLWFDLFLILPFEVVKWVYFFFVVFAHTLMYFVVYLTFLISTSLTQVLLSSGSSCKLSSGFFSPTFVLYEQFDQSTSVVQECSTCNPGNQSQWFDRNHMWCVESAI